KDRNFQANHNTYSNEHLPHIVVFDTTKIEIFKQITTQVTTNTGKKTLCLIPQR
ncbi:hypothetical protein HMPREF3218_0202361, partial [Prevotella bivia]